MARAACNHLHLLPSLVHPLKSTLFTNHTLSSTRTRFYGIQRRFSSSSSKISMSLKAGIVGLPNVGKSTLFNAVVENGKAQAANFPFCTIEPNVGIVAVPDSRLHVLSDLSKSQRAVPASIEFVDIAGLVKGASQGEGLGNKFLSHIREVDSILQVVRCFEDNDIVHVNGKVDPKSDIDVINLELVFSDLDQIDKRMDRLKKGKAKDSQSKLKEEAEKSALEKIREALLDGKPARSVTLTGFERDAVKHLCLLTMKPVIYVANVAESDLADPANNNYVKGVTNVASELQSRIVTISAQGTERASAQPIGMGIDRIHNAEKDVEAAKNGGMLGSDCK
ncbi:ychF, partial [Mucuna pruriens]